MLAILTPTPTRISIPKGLRKILNRARKLALNKSTKLKEKLLKVLEEERIKRREKSKRLVAKDESLIKLLM